MSTQYMLNSCRSTNQKLSMRSRRNESGRPRVLDGQPETGTVDLLPDRLDHDKRTPPQPGCAARAGFPRGRQQGGQTRQCLTQGCLGVGAMTNSDAMWRASISQASCSMLGLSKASVLRAACAKGISASISSSPKNAWNCCSSTSMLLEAFIQPRLISTHGKRSAVWRRAMSPSGLHLGELVLALQIHPQLRAGTQRIAQLDRGLRGVAFLPAINSLMRRTERPMISASSVWDQPASSSSRRNSPGGERLGNRIHAFVLGWGSVVVNDRNDNDTFAVIVLADPQHSRHWLFNRMEHCPAWSPCNSRSAGISWRRTHVRRPRPG